MTFLVIVYISQCFYLNFILELQVYLAVIEVSEKRSQNCEIKLQGRLLLLFFFILWKYLHRSSLYNSKYPKAWITLFREQTNMKLLLKI